MKHNYSTSSPLHYAKGSSSRVAFNRKELGLIFRIYGRMVAIGEWRDYGITMLKDFSVFSIYRHASEYPIYRVKKVTNNSNKTTVFSVIAMDGRVLNCANDLKIVLRNLETKLIRLVK